MKSRIPLILPLLVPFATLDAQVLEPQTPGGGNSGGGGNNTTIVNKREDKGDRPFLGTDIPIFDPASEQMTWDGKSWNVTDNRVMRARFEKYLNAPEAKTEEDNAYREVLDGILDKLSPNRGGTPDLQGAVSLLPKASEFKIDARLCDSLSHAVYGAFLAQKNVRNLDRMNRELNKEANRLHWNTEQASSGTALSNQKTSTTTKKKTGAGERTTTNSGDVTSGGRTTGYALRLLEIEVLKKANAAKMGISQAQAKIEFQALVLQFLIQRRFEHVVIASRMYRRIFQDGDTKVELKPDSDVGRMFGEGLGTNPTLSTLEAFANEAIRDVDEAVQSFEFLIEKDELESASKRLSEAFFIGEYLPRVRTLEREKKRRVLAFVRDAYQLKSAMEVRDYDLARELVDRMRKEAKDFDYSKARAGIEFYTTMSNAHVQKAKLAAQAGDMEAYAKEMQVAIESWPQNPNLKEISKTVNTITDNKIQTLNDLDRLIAQKNFRQIFENQGRFIAAVLDDPTRQEQLEEILKNVQTINIVILQANKLAETGDKWGAWESVQDSLSEFPQDPELNQAARELNTEVAEFVSMLKRAKKLEDENQIGSSLTWYLKARDAYPRSIYAKQGIDRLTDEFIPSGDPTFDSGSSVPTASSNTTPTSTESALPDALDFN